mmetsp:Transcript_12874/g.17595  ORF Transcript_12874/g.17595 Transcript_12874/m.17595 type:complete len:179 (-) Transcript_12874:81-617(-)|eukprot:CAMPEP_0196575788 /NCGR_PEP_ID=MMETSP1081-20130531/5198_1 /TAXON_ID=36882 /ORGANISM="Pyramimonas amylifera, Strain CCMP720" /LENGTH=178 /DNA_ID=CAMNT_0041894195 /DNA_START=257 /DNA_END=793 /DNA_ORIENTATION=-
MTQEEKQDGSRSELGKLAVWSVTSAKPGNGVDMLRDDNLETYWQSDGAQPHLINIQFQKKVRLKELEIYADYKQDESYTPNKIIIRAGNSFNDLRDIKVVDLEEPVGWMNFQLTEENSQKEYLRAYFIQLVIISNHQNGRDTHLRQIKIYGPHVNLAQAMGHPIQYTTPEFHMYSSIR